MRSSQHQTLVLVKMESKLQSTRQNGSNELKVDGFVSFNYRVPSLEQLHTIIITIQFTHAQNFSSIGNWKVGLDLIIDKQTSEQDTK